MQAGAALDVSPTHIPGGTVSSLGDLGLHFPIWQMGIFVTHLLVLQNPETALK